MVRLRRENLRADIKIKMQMMLLSIARLPTGPDAPPRGHGEGHARNGQTPPGAQSESGAEGQRVGEHSPHDRSRLRQALHGKERSKPVKLEDDEMIEIRTHAGEGHYRGRHEVREHCNMRRSDCPSRGVQKGQRGGSQTTHQTRS